jgi:pimeloyl-ACP methyl ester carboxylesterase
VRRHYHVNPDETYLAGFSGGGRMACTIAFALPEYFGGVVAVCGTNPLNKTAYLRHRAEDRLAVALVTGEADFNRKELEDYMYPFFQDLGVHSRLWVVPKMGHAVPGPEVLAEVYDWLAQDLKRRQADAGAHPGLTVTPTEAPTPLRQATRQVETAEAELKDPQQTWRGAALLQGVVARWGTTEAGDRARKLLEQIQAEPKRVALLAEQGGSEERRLLTAQAKGLERFGDLRKALQAWNLLVKHYPETPEGEKAVAEAHRLANLPYLGVAFAGDKAAVAQVAPKGPAALAGLKPGDVVVRLDEAKVGSAAELRRALEAHRAGDKVMLEVQRDGKPVTLTVELGALPPADD